MAFLDIKGFQLAFESFNDVGDPNVLFIHGNLASKEWWHPSIEIMKSQGSGGTGTLLAADWRGYGESKGIQDVSEIDFKRFALDFVELIEDQGLKDINVVGHSTGGLIAMLAILEKPELFKSLVLLDSVGATGLELELPKDQVLAHFEQMSLNKDYCTQVLAATIDGCDSQSSTFQNLLNITWNCDKPMWKGVIEVLSEKIDITSQMNKLTLPTLILHGDKDLVLPMKMAEKTDSLLPNSELKVIEGHGHSYNMEAPEAFVKDLQNFWQKL